VLHSQSFVTARSGRLCALAHALAARRPPGWAYACRDLSYNHLTSLEPRLFDRLTALTQLYVMIWGPQPCCAPRRS
jgi:hypothetical protein